MIASDVTDFPSPTRQPASTSPGGWRTKGCAPPRPSLSCPARPDERTKAPVQRATAELDVRSRTSSSVARTVWYQRPASRPCDQLAPMSFQFSSRTCDGPKAGFGGFFLHRDLRESERDKNQYRKDYSCDSLFILSSLGSAMAAAAIVASPTSSLQHFQKLLLVRISIDCATSLPSRS